MENSVGNQISKDAQKALKDAISSYNNGELWKCGKKEEFMK